MSSGTEKYDNKTLQLSNRSPYFPTEIEFKNEDAKLFKDKFQLSKQPLFDYDKKLANKLGINNFEPIELMNKSQNELNSTVTNISLNKIESNYKK